MKKLKVFGVMALTLCALASCNPSNSGSNKPSTTPGIKEKEEVEGLKMLYTYAKVSQQFDWEEYIRDEAQNQYYYYNRGNSYDNNISLLNPDNFDEIKTSTKTRKAKSVRKEETGDELEENGDHKQFQGALTETEFFSYTKNLTSSASVKDVKKINAESKEEYNYIYFEMDSGYKSDKQEIQYSIYDNNIAFQDIKETKEVATDKDYIQYETKVEKSKNKMWVGSDNLTFYSVMHKLPKDGEQEPVLGENEKYPVPDNYRSISKAQSAITNLSDVLNFKMNSGLSKLMLQSYYEAVDSEGNPSFNKQFEWYSSTKNETTGEVTLVYNHNETFDGKYAGQQQVEKIYVSLNADAKVTGYGYDFEFKYYGETLQSFNMAYKYSYDTLGNYTETAEEKEIFNPDKYYDYGYLLPTIEDKPLDGQTEEILQRIYQCRLEDKINKPTGLVTDTYAFTSKDYYQNSTSDNYDIEKQTRTDSTLYNDNVVVTYYSEQGADLDTYFYAESGMIQQFNKDGNSYIIRKFNESTLYEDGKITTPNKDGQDLQYGLLDLTMVDQISAYVDKSKTNQSDYLIKYTTELVAAGIDKDTNEFVPEHYVITLQVAIQQQETSTSATVGALITYEMGFYFVEAK